MHWCACFVCVHSPCAKHLKCETPSLETPRLPETTVEVPRGTSTSGSEKNTRRRTTEGTDAVVKRAGNQEAHTRSTADPSTQANTTHKLSTAEAAVPYGTGAGGSEGKGTGATDPEGVLTVLHCLHRFLLSEEHTCFLQVSSCRRWPEGATGSCLILQHLLCLDHLAGTPIPKPLCSMKWWSTAPLLLCVCVCVCVHRVHAMLFGVKA
jgi:hypothetical protein